MAVARDERLYTFLQRSSDLVFAIDSNGRYVDVITHEEDLLLGHPTQLLGSRVRSVLPSPTNIRAHDHIRKAFRTGNTQTFEYPLQVPAGPRWFEARIMPFEDLYGEESVVLWIARDITDRKHIEHQLKETNERFRQLADNTFQHFWIVDSDFDDLVYANSAFLEFIEDYLADRDTRELYFEGQPERRRKFEQSEGILEFINRLDNLYEAFKLAFHPDDHTKLNEAVERIFGNKSTQITIRMMEGDGGVRWVRLQAHPVINEKGQVYRIAGLSQNVTELKQTQKKLEETNQRFRQLADHTDQHFWLVNADFEDLVYANAAFLEYIEDYLTDETTGELYFSGREDLREVFEESNSVFEFVERVDNLYEAFSAAFHPEDQVKMAEAVEQLFQGESRKLKLRVPEGNGEVRWIEQQAYPVLNDDGEVYRIAGLSRDITEFERTKRQLEKTNLRFRELADNTVEHFWLVDADFKNLRYANAPFLEYVEDYLNDEATREVYFEGEDDLRRTYEESDSVFEYLDQIDDFYEAVLASYHPDDHSKINAATERLFQGESVEETIRILEGEDVRWVRMQAHPVTNEDGEIYRIAGLARDITEKKLTEEQLEETNHRFRQLADNTDQHFWMVDAELDDIIYANRATREFWDGRLDETADFLETLREAVHPEDHSNLEDAVRRVFEQKVSLQCRVRGPEGEYHWFEGTAYPVKNESGDVYRIAGITNNITEHKHTEHQLKETGRQFHQLIEDSERPFWLTDADFTELIYANRRFRNYAEDFFEDEDDLIEASLEAVHPEDRQKLREAAQTVQDEPVSLTVRMRSSSDETDRWQLHAHPVTNDDGKVIRVAGFAQDVTEQPKQHD